MVQIAAVQVRAKPPVAPPREGTSCTDRQIYWSVRHGRRCTFVVFDSDPITGYVAGADRYNYLVVSADEEGKIRRCLVHKGSVSVIELHEESTLQQEPQRAELITAIAPYRNWVLRTYFSQATADVAS